jgi:hypothetical protein
VGKRENGVEGEQDGKKEKRNRYEDGTHGGVFFVGKGSCRMKKVGIDVC